MENVKETEENPLAPHFALLAVQFFFGAAAVLGKVALQAFPSYSIVGFRVVSAALAFYILQRIRGSLALEKLSDYFYFALFALFGVVLNQLFFFKGLSLTTATNTSLFAVMIPVFAYTISALIGNDKFSWRKIAGIALAAVGVVYLIDPSKASFSSATTQGDILVILNSLCYGTYIAMSKRLISHYGALRSLVWLFLFASIVIAPIGATSLRSVDLSEVSAAAWMAMAAIVLFPTILAYFWNAWALARVEPSVVAVYIYLQPLIGTCLAIFVLGEQWSSRIFLAMILIFAGVFLVTRNRKREVISKI